MLNLLFLLLGFIPLICGANFFVDGSSSLAKKFNIPNIVIGLTVVAFGTSAPELVVNLLSSINETPDITMGNVMGSNIFNITVILGISAVIKEIHVKTNTTWKEVPLTMLAGVCVFIMINDEVIDGGLVSEITRSDGLILLLFFMIFLSYIFSLMRAGDYSEEIVVKSYSARKSVFFMVTGLILLILGGRVIVVFAANFARYIGLSERVISLVIISVGTSLPELTTTISATLKNNVDMAIGNVAGSNIFNIFLILGLSSVVYPIPLSPGSNLDILLNLIASLLLFLFIFLGRGRKIQRGEGILLISIYLFYLIYLLM